MSDHATNISDRIEVRGEITLTPRAISILARILIAAARRERAKNEHQEDHYERAKN